MDELPKQPDPPVDPAEQARQQALAACKLLDNPFDPEHDPDTKFSFRDHGVSLIEPLDVFGSDDPDWVPGRAVLEPYYFSKLGCFSALVQETNTFLQRRGRRVDARSPFSVLVSGSDQLGMNSAASYVAHQLRLKSSRRPALKQIQLDGDDYSSFLALVTAAVKAHAKKNGSDVEDAVKPYEELIKNAEAAQVPGFYLNLLSSLRDTMRTVPWLILIVDDIKADARFWIARSQSAFGAAKVVPIYLSKASATLTYFKSLVEKGFDGLCVALTEMDPVSASEFVCSRIKTFRAGTALSDSFPFAPQTVSQLVSGEKNGVPIKFLIRRLVGAVEAKVEELTARDPAHATDADVEIHYEDIKRLFKGDLDKH